MRNGRTLPDLSEALTALAERPALTLSQWAVLNDVNRSTASRAVASGEVEGAYRVGGQTRIASAPWRAKLGLLAPPTQAA